MKNITGMLNIPLISLTSKKYDGMIGMSKDLGRFPSSKRRFCTSELKIKPTIDYLLDEVKDNFIMIEGIRADESILRSKMKATCQYFKYYFEPYRSNSLVIENLENRDHLTEAQKRDLAKARERLAAGFEDKKYFTYRKAEVIQYVLQYATDVIRPFFHHTAHSVIQYIIDNGQVPNPLYYMGAARVGCYPCINSSLPELYGMADDTATLEKLKKAELEVGRTFFAPNKIPKKYQTGFDQKSGKKIPTSEDVFRYVKHTQQKPPELWAEPEESRRCMSHYGICE